MLRTLGSSIPRIIFFMSIEDQINFKDRDLSCILDQLG